MHFLKTAVILGAVAALLAPAMACDKDKTANADQAKQQQAASQTATTDGNAAKNPHGS